MSSCTQIYTLLYVCYISITPKRKRPPYIHSIHPALLVLDRFLHRFVSLLPAFIHTGTSICSLPLPSKLFVTVRRHKPPIFLPWNLGFHLCNIACVFSCRFFYFTMLSFRPDDKCLGRRDCTLLMPLQSTGCYPVHCAHNVLKYMLI